MLVSVVTGASLSQSLRLAAPWKKPPSRRPRLNQSQKCSAQDVQIMLFKRKYSSLSPSELLQPKASLNPQWHFL